MQLNPDELMKRGYMTALGNYLAKHLIDILHHASGGKHPPAAWVYRDADGNLKHTFNQEICAGKESWGGTAIPISCLADGGKTVFSPKRSELLTYLGTFGLSEKESAAVLDTLG